MQQDGAVLAFRPPRCTGDWNFDGNVSIDELILGVNITLGNLPSLACPPADANNDGEVTIDELMSAINDLGCRAYGAFGCRRTSSGSFGNDQAVSVSPGPVAVVVGDLDNDGIDDAAMLSDADVYLIRSKGDGTFTPFTTPTVSTGSSGGYAIASGVFDTTGFVDLVVTNSQEAGTVSVLLGNGDGTFTAARLNNVGAVPQGVVVAELGEDATPPPRALMRIPFQVSIRVREGFSLRTCTRRALLLPMEGSLVCFPPVNA